MRRPSNLITSKPVEPAPAVAHARPTNYLDLYGLSKPPFATVPDETAFILFGSRRRAFELLVSHLTSSSGIVLLVGDEGTGKSETLRAVATVARESGLEVVAVSRPVGVRIDPDILATALDSLRDPSRKAGLIDDMDLLADSSLGLLSNVAKQDQSPNPLVLVCSSAALTKPVISDIAAKARNVIRLAPLSSSETHQYIERSLWIAGGTTRRLMTSDALKMLIARSHGLPATINRLMEATFNAGFARGDTTITAKTVAAAVGPIAGGQTNRPASSDGFPVVALQVVSVGLLVIGASVFLYKGLSEQPPPPAPPPIARPVEHAPVAEVAKPMSPDLMAALIQRAKESLDLGDVAAARLLFQRAAEAGNATAATALGKTYDPLDPQKAAEWYAKAANLGDKEAAGLLQRLPAKPKGS